MVTALIHKPFNIDFIFSFQVLMNKYNIEIYIYNIWNAFKSMNYI